MEDAVNIAMLLLCVVGFGM